MMNKTELQVLVANMLEREKRVVCMWATGCGKSGVALQFLKTHPDTPTLILVPEQNNIENWREEFRKFDIPIDNVEIACYASFHKYQNREFGLLVFDEAPHVDTEKRKAICSSVSGEHVLALGACITEEEIDTLEEKYGHFVRHYIPLSMAIKMNLVPVPTINVMHLTLDDKKRLFWHKGKALTAKQYYDRLNEEVEKTVAAYDDVSSPKNKHSMFFAGNKRKRFLGQMKEEAIERICKRLDGKGKRYVCFCSSIAQTVKIGGEERSFTSKSPTSMRHLQRFNSGEINALFVVGKLIEGQNLNNIDCGVIGQIGGTQRITIQEVGRILRSENPVVYVPVFDGTKDISFLQTLTSSIPEKYIKHYKF